jgi:hypothetical protein
MAGPLAGLSAAQIAQQKLPEQAAQQPAKTGPSKFDQAMKAQHADQASSVGQANQVQQAQKTQMAKAVEQTGKVEKTTLSKLDVTGKALDPVTQKAEVSKSNSLVMGIMADMEKGQVVVDKLVSGSLNGKNLSNTQLLQLQAGMYKYTQELELTGKVVEKATSGLKDTLKTQV